MLRRTTSMVMSMVVAIVGWVCLTPSAHAGEPDPVAAVEESVPIGRVLASGTVTDSDGQAVQGAIVMARIWPRPESLAGTQEGDSFVPEIVAQTETDVNGRYSLSSGRLFESTRERVTTLPVEFVALSAEGVTSWFTTVDLDNLSIVHDSMADEARSVSISVAQTRGNSGLIVDFEVKGQGPVAMTRAPSGCTLQSNLGARDVVVGQTYSTVNGGHTRQFIYSVSASTTVAVGVSATGTYGTFSMSGTASVSSSATVTFPAYSDSVSRTMKTQFVFGKYKCVYPVTGAIQSYNVYPMSYAGGATVGTVGTPSATYCNTYIPNTHFSLDRSTAITWSDGVSLKSAIGIDVSSRTGYSTTARIEFAFSSNRQLCGQGAYPGTTTPPVLTVVVK